MTNRVARRFIVGARAQVSRMSRRKPPNLGRRLAQQVAMHLPYLLWLLYAYGPGWLVALMNFSYVVLPVLAGLGAYSGELPVGIRPLETETTTAPSVGLFIAGSFALSTLLLLTRRTFPLLYEVAGRVISPARPQPRTYPAFAQMEHRSLTLGASPEWGDQAEALALRNLLRRGFRKRMPLGLDGPADAWFLTLGLSTLLLWPYEVAYALQEAIDPPRAMWFLFFGYGWVYYFAYMFRWLLWLTLKYHRNPRDVTAFVLSSFASIYAIWFFIRDVFLA